MPNDVPIISPQKGNLSDHGYFWRFAASGVFFQGGVASVETNTIISALVQGLTGSPLAVGAAAAITRYGWLFPQIIVAYFAQRRDRRMPFYVFGAFGRALCLAVIALLLWFGSNLPGVLIVTLFFILWTVYGFVSGIVGVPYNDIVARSVPSSRRSRLLAIRFFGGGVLALFFAWGAHEILSRISFLPAYATILFAGAIILAISATLFVSATEIPAPLPPKPSENFKAFLKEGISVVKEDRRFRTFLYVQWLASVVSMSLPFYILQVAPDERAIPFVGILLGAQTAGALTSSTLWGWWGDHRGKLSLLRLVSTLNVVGPTAMLLWMAFGSPGSFLTLPWFAAIFFILGAVGNGRAIAYIGYLMEISPEDRRPAYSGYFNAMIAPAALFPVLGAGIAAVFSFATVFALSLFAALIQIAALLFLMPKAHAHPNSWFQWQLAKLRYHRHGLRLDGNPTDQVWYFAYGANMHETSFQERRQMKPLEWRVGCFRGYRLRFNLEGRPIGKSAPANVSLDPNGEVWGVLYLITRADLVYLDWTEGVPGSRYSHLWVEAEDVGGNPIHAVTYIADGKEKDGNPSLRYLTLIQEGALTHGLPEPYLQFLNNVKSAE